MSGIIPRAGLQLQELMLHEGVRWLDVKPENNANQLLWPSVILLLGLTMAGVVWRHAAGDKVLKAVAACLTSCLREGDTLSRLEGDEFVILLLNITLEEEAFAVAQKILDTISELCLIPVGARNIHLGGSIGISMFPQDGTSFEELLKNTDATMYRAKEAGHNTFQFYAG